MCLKSRARPLSSPARTIATPSFSTPPAACKSMSRWCRNWSVCATWSSPRKFCSCWTPPPARRRLTWPPILTRLCQITGAILTKLDGDARGGAALSLRAVTGKPIKFAGVGEKLEEFEPFHPERMASRILGMGDVVSLVERAVEAVDVDDARRMEEKMRKGQFTLEDFLEQLRQMKKLGSLESLVGMLPGGAEMLKGNDFSKQEKEFRRMEGIICAMTPQERRTPADS